MSMSMIALHRAAARVSPVFFLLLITPSVVAFAPPVAYLDPGTGMVLLQAILGFFMGLLVALGVWWNRVKAFVARLFGRGSVPQDDE